MTIDQDLLRRMRALPERQLFEQLKRIHARRAETPAGRTVQPTPITSRGRESEYDRARRLFVDEEKRLRKQTMLTDQVIEQLRERHAAERLEPEAAAAAEFDDETSGPRSTQETLFLRAALGSRAAGRFRLVSHHARATDVSFDVAPVRRSADATTVSCRVVVTPPVIHLDPGAECVVRVSIDCADAEVELCAGDVLETEVVARSTGLPLHRLWVELELYALEEGRSDR